MWPLCGSCAPLSGAGISNNDDEKHLLAVHWAARSDEGAALPEAVETTWLSSTELLWRKTPTPSPSQGADSEATTDDDNGSSRSRRHAGHIGSDVSEASFENAALSAAEVTRDFVIQLKKSEGRKFGVSVAFHEDEPDVMRVSAVKVGGALAAWNQDHPERRVEPGFVILMVNSDRTSDGMVEAFQNDSELELLIGEPIWL
mmetsp:Transcript_70642/g.169288  ORF Transcript_70642/g.169288 Transcript_70642/m.169288 type:complete len:201 (-) Transcript_70642:222-824(-)